jgi:hypothetical protein
VKKEGEEARQPFPVSDILVQWPLCMTSIVMQQHDTTQRFAGRLFLKYFFNFRRTLPLVNLAFTDLPFGMAI